MKTMTIRVALGLLAGESTLEEEPEGPAAAVRLVIREVWDPACLLAIRELKGIEEPEEFEEAALRWLESQEPYLAAEIAADHGRELLDWWHEEVNNTPYGMTVVALGGRMTGREWEAAATGGRR